MRLGWPDDLWYMRDSHKNPKSSSSSSDDCVILDGDPDKESDHHQLQVQLRNDEELVDDDDELVVVAEKGQIACRDYPHARHLCVTFPFNTSPHEKYCDLCHCYVCDILAPCSYWGTGNSSDDHCHSTDKEDLWRELRKLSKEVKLAQLPVPSLLETTLSNEQTLDFPQPLTTNEERVVELDLVSLALDQAAVRSDRLTGIVKWFDSQKGYGFITHEDGEDLFVHHSSIKSKGHQSLTEGERVEFAVDVDDHGRGKATNVTGPGGSFVQGASGRDSCATDFSARGGRIPGDRTFIGRAGFPTRRGAYGTNRVAGASSRGGSILQGITNNDDNGNSNTDALKCYICWEMGHLASNCNGGGGGNDNTVRMRVARGGGREDSGSRVGVSHRGGDYGRNRTAGLSSPGESLLQETTRDNDSSRDSDTLKCYNCGEFGHSIRNCDGGGGGSNNRVRVDGGSAYRRGEIGRNRAAGLTSRDRSLFQGITGGRNGNLPRERQCFTCGELGHLMRDCNVRSDPFGSSNSSNNHRTGGFVGDTNSGWSFELSNNRYNERNNTVSQRNSSGNLPRGNTRGGSHSGERGNSVRDHHSTERSGGGCFICGKTGHQARDCSKERGSGRNDASVRDHHSTERSGSGCFICGKTGHQARDCSKERGSGRNDGGVSSCSCGEDGWHLLNCPRKHNGGRGRAEVPCFTCHEPGHSPMDCPKKHQIWRELHYGF